MKSAAAISEEFKHYAYSVSHDVSAPVRALVEFSKLLASEEPRALSPDGREYLSLIVENGRKLQAMMDGLLQYSRLNTQAAKPTLIDMQQVVQAVIADSAATIQQTRANIEVGTLPSVNADAWQMTQLFHALIDNALKFHPPGNIPQIHISSRPVASGIAFSVHDNGIGVDPSYCESIFGLFKRLHTDDEYPGVGIGLTIARKIAEHHGGTLTCATDEPCGACFTFVLPARET